MLNPLSCRIANTTQRHQVTNIRFTDSKKQTSLMTYLVILILAVLVTTGAVGALIATVL